MCQELIRVEYNQTFDISDIPKEKKRQSQTNPKNSHVIILGAEGYGHEGRGEPYIGNDLIQFYKIFKCFNRVTSKEAISIFYKLLSLSPIS